MDRGIKKGLNQIAYRIRRKISRNLYLSFGENCLTDIILNRYDLKSFATPYSHGRSNIEYIIHMEKQKFDGLLEKSNLTYDFIGDKRVVRSTIYNDATNIYESMCMKGFEFTHHDVIGNEEMRCNILRRCNRLLGIQRHNVFIIYHHRYCPDTDFSMLIDHLLELKDIYKQRGNKVHIVLFTQIIVKTIEERKLVQEQVKGVDVFWFKTLLPWAGEYGEDVFLGKTDSDLFEMMVSKIKKMRTKKA